VKVRSKPKAVFQACGMNRTPFLLGHPRDPTLFADATGLRYVWLHDVECPLLEP